MKTQSRILSTTALALVSIASAVFTLQSGAQNIVRNGSFELTDIYGQPFYWSPVSMNLGWPNAPAGRNYVYIASVSQTLSTTPGQAYALSFWVAGDLLVSPTSTVGVNWGGQNAGTFTTQPHGYDQRVNRYLQLVWEQDSATVVATATSTLLTFTSLNDTYLCLDDVRVVVVPEPSAPAFLLLGALGLLARRAKLKT